MENTISLISSLFFFSSFFSPRLLNPASLTNLFKSFIFKLSSYSIKAVAITKLTEAFIIPSCLFRYFSRPFEQALQVMPSIFKTIFFIFSPSGFRDGPKIPI